MRWISFRNINYNVKESVLQTNENPTGRLIDPAYRKQVRVTLVKATLISGYYRNMVAQYDRLHTSKVTQI